MAKKTTGLDKKNDSLIYTGGSSSISEVKIEQIDTNPYQPRQLFAKDTLNELAASIRKHGVISPITLRKNEDGAYQIIAGERRFRAAKMAGLDSIPAYIKTDADDNILEIALIENIQREDLNAIEIALAYNRLMEEYKLTQERLSERVSKSRESVANYLRLLRLPADIQMGIKNKKISMGHARAILGVPDPEAQLQLYEAILKYGYSVRKIEEMARIFNEKGSFDPKSVPKVVDTDNQKETDDKQEPDEIQEETSNETFDSGVRFSYESQSQRVLKVAVDFDGTIVTHEYPYIGKEIPFAIDTLKLLQQRHNVILILWTVRVGERLEEAVEYCRQRGLEFYAVNKNYMEEEFDDSVSRKLNVDLFIDDRNIGGLPDWGIIYRMITEGKYLDPIPQSNDFEYEERTKRGFISKFFG